MSEQDIKQELMPKTEKAPDHSCYSVGLPRLVRELHDALNDRDFIGAEHCIRNLTEALRELEQHLFQTYVSTAPHPVMFVAQFHNTFGHPIREEPVVPPAKERLFRVRLLMEEAAEFCVASGFPVHVSFIRDHNDQHHVMPLNQVTPEMSRDELIDIVGVADGLGDINVVNNGAALVWGIPIEAIDAEIHRSNMSKLGLDGKPITDEHGKIMKGPNYTPPDLKKILGICN